MPSDFALWARRLRTALFLTCITSIASALGYLDGFDALALKFLPEDVGGQGGQQVGPKVDTVVLGITTDFFETEFGGRTPIDRDRFQKLIKDVLTSYPAAKVIAIDYDFSPGGEMHCANGENPSGCAIAAMQANQQARFDKFLTRDLKRFLGDRQVSVVLVDPLPSSEDSMPEKRSWQNRLSESGIRFGDYTLLSHDWFGTVVKHVPTNMSADPCSAKEDAHRPFAAVVNDARACMSGDRRSRQGAIEENESSSLKGEKVSLINFGEARKEVLYCPLWEWSDVTENCQRHLNSISSSRNLISTVFIGASYGQEDRFRTPLGDLYGVELHAYSAYSLLHPVRGEETFKFCALLIDIVLGLLSACVFDYLWERTAEHKKYSMCRLVRALDVFVVLIGLVWVSIRVMPWMLDQGIWMNPFVILAGFFIDSYQASIEKFSVHGSEAQPEPSCNSKSWLREFFGCCAEGKSLVTGSALKAPQGEAWLQLVRKIVVYWLVVIYAAYLLLAK